MAGTFWHPLRKQISGGNLVGPPGDSSATALPAIAPEGGFVQVQSKTMPFSNRGVAFINQVTRRIGENYPLLNRIAHEYKVLVGWHP